MLTIYPNGGLCNRLFALHSAIRLSEDIGQPLRVVWIVRGDFGCRFDELFELPPEVAQWHHFSHLQQGVASKVLEAAQRYLRWPALLPKMFPTDVVRLTREGFDFTSLRNQKRSDISSFSLFYRGSAGFCPFRPREHLRTRIDEITGQFHKTVGLHIRRTDHLEAIKNSPTSRFEAEMERVLAAEPDATFFAASDSREEIDRLSRRFPGRILSSHPSSLARDTQNGMEGAVVDLFCLAGTDRILGSSGSTFSEAAGLIGGIDVTYMQAAESER